MYKTILTGYIIGSIRTLEQARRIAEGEYENSRINYWNNRIQKIRTEMERTIKCLENEGAKEFREILKKRPLFNEGWQVKAGTGKIVDGIGQVKNIRSFN